jgi:hypothetical protein
VYTIWAGAKGGKGERETAHPFAIDPGPDPDPDPDPVHECSERDQQQRAETASLEKFEEAMASAASIVERRVRKIRPEGR